MSPEFKRIVAEAAELIALCRTRGLRIVTAESCTGGLVAAVLTEVPGSSDVFDRGFVTYSNAAKVQCLGVALPTIERHGAVSEETAIEMAEGAIANSTAELAIAITGIAGPGGGTAEKPVGLVHLCAVRRHGTLYPVVRRYGDIGRSEVRLRAASQALSIVRALIVPEASGKAIWREAD
jgi:nicotinamide-nucleotide amidase